MEQVCFTPRLYIFRACKSSILYFGKVLLILVFPHHLYDMLSIPLSLLALSIITKFFRIQFYRSFSPKLAPFSGRQLLPYNSAYSR